MRLAIIDLGTNSVRFDVHSFPNKGQSQLLHREKLMVRLGQGVFFKGRIDEAVVDRTVEAFRRFEKAAEALRVGRVLAFGTSALREAQNSQLLIDSIRQATGIEITVISGAEEAHLIALGILANERSPKGKFALLDIGGGSTEISICQGKKVLKAHSFSLGTARLQQVFLKSIPPKPAAIDSLRDYARQMIGEKVESGKWPKTKLMIGSSGTVKAVAKILDEKRSFSLRQLSALVKRLAAMNVSQLLDVEGMEPKRVDMILAGAILLEEACLQLGVTEIRPTEFSLRDGIFEEQRRLLASHSSSVAFHRKDILAKAVRFGQNDEHVRFLADLAEKLFTRLHPVHRLDPNWRAYLVAASVLRNCGELVGFQGRDRHSYYLVKHSDLPGLAPWEHEFIALLCRHFAGGKLSAKDLSPLGKDPRRRAAFLKLLALLRLLDALDPGPGGRLRIGRIKISPRKVEIYFGGEGVAGVEFLLTDRKKNLFEESFKRQLFVNRSK